MQERELTGKVALVTGAGSGIGRATALLFAQQGAAVGLLGRTESELREVAGEIQRRQGRAQVLVADVADAAAVQRAVDQLAREFQRLDIVFANAGVNGVWAPIEELSPEDWQKTLNINLSGTFYTIKYAVPHLKRQGGSVIVCASVNGTRMFSNTGASAYASTKAAQAALTKMLAVELGPQRVRVNVICPGAIATEIDDNTSRQNLDQVKRPVEFPQGSIPLTGRAPGKPEQVAEVVLFLASDRSSHVSGTELWVDGAQSLLQG
ncbi:MAG TPA: SDR family NAD(P)-dependent oxidoreductase [Polyangiaceae bacterium]|nr:SDR family NAD(P)-dependent oxidoreductase [Polyangiaceae bacterium]